MRPRFSLLALFFTTTIVAVGCYCLVLPSINARRFVAAIEAEDYAAADRMFIRPEHQFLATLHADSWTWRARISLAPWSIKQLLMRQRSLSIELAYGKPGRLIITEWNIIALENGVSEPQLKTASLPGMSLANR